MSTAVSKDTPTRKKVARSVTFGIVNILITFNNVIVSIVDANGNALVQSSSGLLGFKGSKKSTPYVAGLVVKDALKRASTKHGLRTVGVVVKGITVARDAVLRVFASNEFIVVYLRDETPISHNGCRPKKRRKV